jgi:putative transposase
MSTYTQILYQLVFATKNREHTIPEAHCTELYKYMWGVINDKKCKLHRINGVSDHIHIACDLHPTVALAGLIKDIKLSSNDWMKGKEDFELFKGWGDGYGGFTYSIKERPALIQYIKNQKEHHKTVTFIDEYKLILEEHGIMYDPRYVP